MLIVLEGAKYFLKDFEGAIEDLSKAIELNSSSEKPFYNRGVVKTTLEDHLGAIEDYSKAIELNSSNEKPF